MNRIVKYGLLSLMILTIGLFFVYGIFIGTFDLFGEPEKKILDRKCDYEGLRQATTYNFGGNAVTIPAINVSINMGCGDGINENKKKIVFSAVHKGGTKVKTEWITFDTLQISYSEKLEPITQIDKVTFNDSTLNVIIKYENE